MIAATAAWMFLFAAANAWFARQRHRSPVKWAVIGSVIGPLGLAIIWLAPPGVCQTCASRVQGWLSICAWCGGDVREDRFAAPPATPAEAAPAAEAPARTATASRGRRSAVPPVTQRKPHATPMAPRRTIEDAAEAMHRPLSSVGAAPPSRPPSPAPIPESTLLASGVFIGGSAPLLHGARYAIESTASTIRVIGPVDTAPGTVVVERELKAIASTGVGGRLIISWGDARGPRYMLAFDGVAGRPVDELSDTLNRLADEALTDAVGS